MYRDERTHRPVDYYSNIPGGLETARVFVVDPMLATGGSATGAIEHLKNLGAQQITMVCLVAAPEGVEALQAAHPGVPVITATLDRELDENAYIRPGLGDAGDRIFGTTG
jgi:uracil phosphoribosyltransferase